MENLEMHNLEKLMLTLQFIIPIMEQYSVIILAKYLFHFIHRILDLNINIKI